MVRLPILIVSCMVATGCLLPSSDVDDGGDGGNGGDAEYCNGVQSWPADLVELEEAVLPLVNEHRSRGADCGAEGTFGPTGDLTMNGALRCAARVHTKDMADNSYLDHTNPAGEEAFDRMSRAGYDWRVAGENIAAGQPTAETVMQSWMASSGHCRNIMMPDFEEIGIGAARSTDEFGLYWTQVFGTR